MKNIYPLAFLFLMPVVMAAQSNGLSVYKILQDHCVSCHSNGSPEAGLDLEGTGATESARWATVYNNITNVSPVNATAAAKGDAYVYPGRPDRSFLFRKINDGLDTQLELAAGEDAVMPAYGGVPLTDIKKEIIRQWITFGAPLSGTRFDESVVERYYDNGGVEAFPDGPPPAPAAEEGFQIKIGPFFLPEGGELEFFQKYELDLPENLEVIGLDHLFSNSSHHFIVYRYDSPSSANNIQDGLRLNSYHNDIRLVTAVQGPVKIDLPKGSAFTWENDAILDLNSHYINYSIGEVYKSEAYLNVYTQEQGIASQEMQTEIIPNVTINIPNNEDLITIDQTIASNFLGDIYLWGLMGHTHKYGKDYKVWKRENGVKTEMLYDASCPEAVPGCSSPNFDYQHIPLRLYEPFVEVDMTGSNGIIHQASWLNDGPNNLFFGPTSNDEMMVLVMMYLTDIEGVEVFTDIDELPVSELKVFPNPMETVTEFIGEGNSGKSQLRILDGLGRTILVEENQNAYFRIERANWSSGIYFYEFTSEGFAPVTGKLVVQ